MDMLQVDLAVIGAGPAGQKGAIQGAKAGKKVVLIDRMGMLGGACLHQGTIPSKALRLAILDTTGYHLKAYFGDDKHHEKISMKDLQDRLNRVISDQNQELEQQCKGNDVETIYGSARFVDEHLIEVLDINGEVIKQVVSNYTLIATGSSPRHPIEVPKDDQVFMDSDQVFRMQKMPDRLIVVGGGVIGCEYATMFAALGIEVTLLDRRSGIMRMLDEEIGELFGEHMKQIGVDLRLGLGNQIKELRHSKNGQAEVLMEGGELLEAPCLFYSMGRIANVGSLNLEAAGIELENGNIPVNSLFQTVCPHIYAAGDVIGPPGLASTSMEQGRLAVRNAFMLSSHHFPSIYPFGIYSIPEISSVGPTEQDLREKGIRYEIGRARYREIARGPMAGDTTGLIKILFHAETLELLGVHIIGTNATEIIPIGHMAINFRVKIDYFIDQIFNYPTFSEGFRIAALNGLNKVQSVVGNDSA